MTAEGWGFVAAVGIPLVVIVLAVVWPERVARGIDRERDRRTCSMPDVEINRRIGGFEETEEER
ncbi:hypothetical protein [Nocardia nova]|uniref:hypothetical protein n=1 Tax=Nocardia nova TaxID=37330 RepID=UPI0033E77A3B